MRTSSWPTFKYILRKREPILKNSDIFVYSFKKGFVSALLPLLSVVFSIIVFLLKIPTVKKIVMEWRTIIFFLKYELNRILDIYTKISKSHDWHFISILMWSLIVNNLMAYIIS